MADAAQLTKEINFLREQAALERQSDPRGVASTATIGRLGDALYAREKLDPGAQDRELAARASSPKNPTEHQSAATALTAVFHRAWLNERPNLRLREPPINLKTERLDKKPMQKPLLRQPRKIFLHWCAIPWKCLPAAMCYGPWPVWLHNNSMILDYIAVLLVL